MVSDKMSSFRINPLTFNFLIFRELALKIAKNHYKQLKGIVRRKLRWVKSGINRSAFLNIEQRIFILSLKGHHPLNSVKLFQQ
jgi:hypothetical protein